MGRQSRSHARFFLASVSEQVWAPRVVAVRRGDVTVGLLYAKERLLAGVPTGVIYSDGVLTPAIDAAPLHHYAVLDAAVSYLFTSAGIRGLRMILPPGGFEGDVLAGVARSMALEIDSCNVETHSRLALPATHDEFLKTLGSRTRRNFRYYSRRSQAAGNQFVARLSIGDFKYAAWYLARKSKIKADAAALERALSVLSVVDCPLLVGLRRENGDWLSIAGGWYGPTGATLFFQLNRDREFAVDSLATVLRAHLIGTLIEQGIPELSFWSGTSGALSRYVQTIPAVSFYIDVPTQGWRMLRSFVSFARDWIPEKAAGLANWISPPRLRTRS